MEYEVCKKLKKKTKANFPFETYILILVFTASDERLF